MSKYQSITDDYIFTDQYWYPVPENAPAGKVAGSGTAIAAQEQGNHTLEPSDDGRGFQRGDTTRTNAESLSNAATATGTASQGAAAAAAAAAAKGGTGQVKEQQLNNGAHRNKPLNPNLKADLGACGDSIGATPEVFSGGQSPHNRIGSTRHNHGNAADLKLRDNATGRMLNMNNGADQARMASFVRCMVSKGAAGVGAGNSYMGPESLHIGYGTPAAWGAGGKGRNAPSWLVQAWNEGRGLSGGVAHQGRSGGGGHAANIVAVDEAAKILGPWGSVAAATGFGGVQRNASIAAAAMQAFNASLGNKPVFWLAENGPGMGGWQAFLESGSKIANGYMSPIEHLTAWGMTWFSAFPGVPNQLWRGGLGFNQLTNADDILQQIALGGNFTHILNSSLGGLGLAGLGGSGSTGTTDIDAGLPFDEERPSGLPREVPYFVRVDTLDSESALIRNSTITSMPYATDLVNGLDCCVEEKLTEQTQLADLSNTLIRTGLVDPLVAYNKAIRNLSGR